MHILIWSIEVLQQLIIELFLSACHQCFMGMLDNKNNWLPMHNRWHHSNARKTQYMCHHYHYIQCRSNKYFNFIINSGAYFWVIKLYGVSSATLMVKHKYSVSNWSFINLLFLNIIATTLLSTDTFCYSDNHCVCCVSNVDNTVIYIQHFVVLWHHPTTRILVDTGSDNSLLPDGTKWCSLLKILQLTCISKLPLDTVPLGMHYPWLLV